MAAKDFVGFMSRTRSTPLRFGTASPALSPLTVGLAEPCGFSTGGLGELSKRATSKLWGASQWLPNFVKVRPTWLSDACCISQTETLSQLIFGHTHF